MKKTTSTPNNTLSALHVAEVDDHYEDILNQKFLRGKDREVKFAKREMLEEYTKPPKSKKKPVNKPKTWSKPGKRSFKGKRVKRREVKQARKEKVSSQREFHREFLNELSERARERVLNTVILLNIPMNFNEFYNFLLEIRHPQERNHVQVGRYIHEYYFNNLKNYNQIYDNLRWLKGQLTRAYRMDIIFGSIWEDNRDQNNITYFDRFLTQSENDFFRFRRPNGQEMGNIIIRNNENLQTTINQLDPNAIRNNVTFRRENTQFRIICIYTMLVRITLLDAPIGSKTILPDYLKNIRAINGLENIEDNLCFFACYVIHSGAATNRCINKAKQIYEQFYGESYTSDYPGFDYVNELEEFEDQFNISVIILSINEDLSADTIRTKDESKTTKMYLNLYLNHFSYIRDVTKALKSYRCSICIKQFRDNFNLARHLETCGVKQENKFPRLDQTLYRKPENIIYELCENYEYFNQELTHLKKDLYKYDYLIGWDIECWFNNFEHVPVCIAIYTNMSSSNYYIFDKNPNKLVKRFFETLDILVERIGELMRNKMKILIDTIKEFSDNINKDSGRTSEINDINEYCNSVPVIGFNTGKYDINVLNKYGFIGEILKRDDKPFVIKNGKQYKQIRIKTMNFIDQILYCAGGTNLKSFIKEYTGKDQKFVFPYEKFTSLSFLDRPVNTLTVNDFESSLKGKNTLFDMRDKEMEEKYKKFCSLNKSLKEVREYESSELEILFEKFKTECQNIWDKTIYDLLEYYANLDVKPLIEACTKQRENFYEFRIEMYKDTITLSSLSQIISCKFIHREFDKMWNERKKIVSIPKVIRNQLQISEIVLQRRISQYEAQDINAKRNIPNITTMDILGILQREKYRCFYCDEKM
jgi:hypothetical protein